MDATRTTTAAPRRPRRRAVALVMGVASTAAVLIANPSPASASSLPVTTGLVSRSSTGEPAGGASTDPSLSGNARFVAFASEGKALVPGDTNNLTDVFVKDRWSQAIERVSVTDSEAQAAGESLMPSISDDGRYVAFVSDAANLIAGDNQGLADAFVRDRVLGTTTRVAPGLGNALLDQAITSVAISGNGRYVAVSTAATNVISGDTNGDIDIFVRDLQSSSIERVSITAFEGQANGNSSNPSLSDDGRYVAFDSAALLAGGAIGENNVYVRDRTGATTMLVNVNSAETVSNASAGSPMISGNGRYVVFGSFATNLTGGDANSASDIFRRDLEAGNTIMASVAHNGAALPANSYGAVISDDGTQIGFASAAVATTGDAGADTDMFVRNLSQSSTRRVSRSASSPDPSGSPFGLSLDDSGDAATFQYTLPLTADNKASQVYVNDQPTMGPINSVDTFLNQQYTDFLGRPASAAEKVSWNDKFTRGSATPITVIATLASDPAFSAKRAPVVRLYWAFFLRKPDPSGLSYWIDQFQKGTSLSTIAQKFSQSSEFKNRYGALTNQGYVKLIYPNIFGRQPDPSGLAYWTGKLDRKEITRGGVLIGFSESSEGIRRLAPQVNITLISQGMLRVSPSAAYWDQAFPVYQAGEKELAWMAAQTLGSAAYWQRLD